MAHSASGTPPRHDRRHSVPYRLSPGSSTAPLIGLDEQLLSDPRRSANSSPASRPQTDSTARSPTSERIFPIKSILTFRKDSPGLPRLDPPERLPLSPRDPSNSSSSPESPVSSRDHLQQQRHFALSNSMSRINEHHSTSNGPKTRSSPSKPSSSRSSRSSATSSVNLGAGMPFQRMRAISLANMASANYPRATRASSSSSVLQDPSSPGMLINISGLHDLPLASTDPHPSTPNTPLESNTFEKTTQLSTADSDVSSRPPQMLPNPLAPAEISAVGEPPAGNAIASSAAEPTSKPNVIDGYLTTRFQHAQTDEGFIILTGRSGEITSCEEEPIRVPGAIQAFGVLIAVVLHGDLRTPHASASSHHSPSTNSAFYPLEPESPTPEEDSETHEPLQFTRAEVVQVSENSGHILGHSPQKLLSIHSLTDIFPIDERQVLYDNLEVTLEGNQEEAGPHTFRISGHGGYGSGLEGRSSRSTWTCWCAAHRPDPVRRPRLIVIEFELEDDTINPPSVISMEPLSYEERGGMAGEPYQPTKEDLIQSTRTIIKPIKALARLRKKGKDFSGDSVEVLSILGQVNQQFDKAQDMSSFLKMVVGVVRELTGFHRVMVYQFDDKWNGQVVAELVDWKRTRDLYRGLRFPSSDIPAQARELYRVNKVRMLYDRDMPTARIVCRSLKELETPLDMTHCHLRAMSPIHIRYLANMGVRASFSISIMFDNSLWGLISCHSYGRYGHRVTFPTRHFCRILGESVSRTIERLQLCKRLESRKLINTSATAANPSGYIIAKAEDLLWLFDAPFGLVSIGDEAKILGVVQNSQEVLAMLEYLRIRSFDTMQTVTDISETFADIAYPTSFKSICGMMVIPLARGGQDFIAFFREAQVKEVHWAGNPYEKMGQSESSHKSCEECASLRSLEPRKSFKIWSETVRGQSKSWTEAQIDTGLTLSLVYGKFIDVWRQKEAAVHTNQLQTLLLSNASHEVRTPLHQILSTLELALDGTLDNETRDNLSRSYHASKSLVHVINDLLDLTKAEHGGDLFSRDPLHLPSMVEDAVSIHRREAVRMGLMFDAVQQEGTPSTVIGDRARIRQLLSNLVGNALKHTAQGSILIYWGLTESGQEPNRGEIQDQDCIWISFSVTDTGRGIPGHKLDAIFRSLENVNKSAEGNEPSEPPLGIGLGLAVVGRVVDTLGGQLRVDSTENEGSKFTIVMPFKVADSTAGSVPSYQSSLGVSEESAQSRVHLSDESAGSKSSVQRQKLRAMRSRHGGTDSGSGHHSEIDGLVEALQAPTSTADSPPPVLNTPFSPNRCRIRLRTRGAPPPPQSTSAEEGQTGSSSSSHSFEWPEKNLNGAAGDRVSSNSSTSTAPAMTPREPNPESPTPVQRTFVWPPHVRMINEANPARCPPGNAQVGHHRKTSSPAELGRSRKRTESDTPVKVTSLLLEEHLPRRPDESERPLSRMSGSVESKGIKPGGGSQALHHSSIDHVSNFTPSPNARVMSEEPMKVMVVDDDPINRVILKKKLTQSGHQVALAAHGQEAVELFCSNVQFDIILMDLQMPICDGLEATRRIRDFEHELMRDPPEKLPHSHLVNMGVPILAVSASLHEGQRVEISSAGMDGWILKPVDFNRLATLMVGAADLRTRAAEVYQPGLWEKGGYLALPKRVSKTRTGSQ